MKMMQTLKSMPTFYTSPWGFAGGKTGVAGMGSTILADGCRSWKLEVFLPRTGWLGFSLTVFITLMNDEPSIYYRSQSLTPSLKLPRHLLKTKARSRPVMRQQPKV